jgi:pimeloyl-ACP methyl ester carboxylesterase
MIMSCRTTSLAFLLLLFVTMPAAADPDPLLVSTGRIDAIAQLIGQDSVDKTMARITTHYGVEGPGSWGYEWNALGQKLEEKGDKKLGQGKADKALEEYMKAQQVYRLGYLPENFRHDERIAWASFAAIQHKINGLVETPFVEELISVDGHAVTIQLYLPPAGGPTPGFVLYTGGVDGSKESGLDSGRLYAAAGYAMAAFDLQGTGELVDWFATPESFSLHRGILDHYQSDPRFDFSRVGVLGGSFGGYYAIQLAADGIEPRLKASINHCGLVSALFENIPPEFVLRNFVLPTPDGDRPRSFMRRIGFDPDDFVFDDLVSTFGAFSLAARGVVGTGSPTLSVPILTVNGGRDSQLSPISDMESVQASAEAGEMWVLGLAGHCADDYMSAARPDMVRWSVCAMEGVPAAECSRE